jgi:ring-1,2-phenylacetyl-CoA epoxidase subunit PaaC
MEHAVDYVLRIGDACLVHGQRLAEWTGHAPVIEEDIALANIALDHIGQARALLTLAGELEGRGRDEDALAYWRSEFEFRNPTALELPRGDFGFTVLRGFLWASFMKVLCQALAGSTNAQLAAIATKSLKEVRYHQQHLGDWVVRLGDGTAESKRRVDAALVRLWPYTAEWFDADAVDAAAAASALGPSWGALQAPWRAEVDPVLAEAGLEPSAPTPFRSTGKTGRHSEHMGYLLAEMQSVQRAFPGATW